MRTARLTTTILIMLSLTFFFNSCKKDQQESQPSSVHNESEIARIEKETGQKLFKRDIIYNHGGNFALLRLATKNETFFKEVVENYEVSIMPLHKGYRPFNLENDVNKKITEANITGET